MAQQNQMRLMTQPETINFGLVYVGSRVCGSLKIQAASSCKNYYNLDTKEAVPEWLKLEGPTKSDEGLLWTYFIRTEKPGHFVGSLRFECDTGVALCRISLDIRDGTPPLGEIAFCNSPFEYHASYFFVKTLVRILNVLPVRIHCLDSLAEIGQIQLRTIVLHQTGLLKCNSADVELLARIAKSGTNILVLADEFYRGTNTTANDILIPFGLQMKQSGRDEPNLSHEQRMQRIFEWQARYDCADFVSGPSDICAHRLTQGVKRVLWSRPCPVLCTGPSSTPLIKNPLDNQESFAAFSKSTGSIVAIGNSLWSSLSSAGWPYNNDRLLANCLVGDDAELHTHWFMNS